jgi:hypothetical protein
MNDIPSRGHSRSFRPWVVDDVMTSLQDELTHVIVVRGQIEIRRGFVFVCKCDTGRESIKNGPVVCTDVIYFSFLTYTFWPLRHAGFDTVDFGSRQGIISAAEIGVACETLHA